MKKQEKYIYIISIILILISGLIHILTTLGNYIYRSNNLIFVLYATAIVLWFSNIKNKILHKTVQNRFLFTTFLLIMVIAVRTIKYEIPDSDHFLNRYLWYSYYLFYHMVVVSLFVSVLHINKSERENINPKWNLFYIPALLISLMILTNDFHQFVFRFENKTLSWLDGYTKYTYGPGYLISTGFFGLIILMIFLAILVQSAERKRLKVIWIPLLPIISLSLYTYLYSIRWEPFYWFKVAFKSPEFNCISIMLFIESLIRSNLLPTNDRYEEFLKMSSLKIGIIDNQGRSIALPKRNIKLNQKLIEKAENETILLDPNTILESSRIQGGKSYWIKDISNINRLKKELLDLGDVIKEENELLGAENQIKEDLASIKEQGRIYDRINERLKDTRNELNQILDSLPNEEETFQKEMKRAAIINAYIKRYSNLLLMAEKQEEIDLGELKLSIQEPLMYVKLYGIDIDLDWKAEGSIDVKDAIKIYKLLQESFEYYLPKISTIGISCQRKEGLFQVSMVVIKKQREDFKNKKKEFIVRDNIQVKYDSKGNSLSLTFIVLKKEDENLVNST